MTKETMVDARGRIVLAPDCVRCGELVDEFTRETEGLRFGNRVWMLCASCENILATRTQNVLRRFFKNSYKDSGIA